MADKVKYGVRKVHYALATQNGFAAPVAMPGAVSLTLTPNGDTNTFFADDTRFYVTVANNGYDAELEVAYVPESFLTDVLGMTLNATDKVIVEKTGVQPKPFALLFEEEGDDTGTKFVLYNCIATRPNRSLSTTTDTIDPQTQTISISALPMADNKVLAFTGAETPSTVLDGWYTTVWGD